MTDLKIANRLLKPLGFRVLQLKDNPYSIDTWTIADSAKNPIYVTYYGYNLSYRANFSSTANIIIFLLKYIVAIECISNPYFNKTLEEALILSDMI